MLDDPKLNDAFEEFLLQVQGRLMCGSNNEGMSVPQAAAVMVSSNSAELAR